jgi:methyltransferase family protein
MSQAASPSPDLPGDPAPIIGEPPRLIRKIDKWRFRPWFRHGEFSTDWATSHFSVWRRVLAPLRGSGADVLEIGSWEGRSAIFFLNYLRDCRIACIDTFAGGVEHQTAGPFVAEVPRIEQRFDHNLAAFKDRVEKIRSASVPALQRLATDNRQFDLAYIDGSHMRDDVAADSTHVWPLVRRGGIVIWDDYTWSPSAPPEERPQPAIDAFLAAHEGQYRLLAKGLQVIVRRLS